MPQYVVSVAAFAKDIDSFFDQARLLVTRGQPQPIAGFFANLPISPTSEATKRRLIRRGDIATAGGKLSNDGPEVNAEFNDDNLGQIRITFPAQLRGKVTVTGTTLLADFSANPIAVQLSPKENVPIAPGQSFVRFEARKGQEIRFIFQEQANPSVVTEIVGAYSRRSIERCLRNLRASVASVVGALLTAKRGESCKDRLRSFTGLFVADYGCSCSGTGGGGGSGKWVVNRATMSGICYVQQITDRPQLGLQLNGTFATRDAAQAYKDQLVETTTDPDDPNGCNA
jgi:hypothetical protein